MFGRYHRNRFLLLVGTVACILNFWFVGDWFGIPRYENFNISLLAQPSPVTTLLIVAATMLICTAVATLITGSVRADAGLFTAAIGLIALAERGGSMRYTLFDAPSASTVRMLAMELVVLYVIIAIAWLLVAKLAQIGLTRQNDDDFNHDEMPLDQKLIATAIQACGMATLVLILCRSDNKTQALASVGVAAFLGSMLAVVIAPARPSVWYWTGPLIVGLLGYLWPGQNALQLSIGQTAGYFAALARPLPIHYASAGVAGAMLGYWFGRSWARENEEADDVGTNSTAEPQPNS